MPAKPDTPVCKRCGKPLVRRSMPCRRCLGCGSTGHWFWKRDCEACGGSGQVTVAACPVYGAAWAWAPPRRRLTRPLLPRLGQPAPPTRPRCPRCFGTGRVKEFGVTLRCPHCDPKGHDDDIKRGAFGPPPGWQGAPGGFRGR